jgi:transposase-like protein
MNAIEQSTRRTKTHRSAAQWQQIIDGYATSGLTQADYCQEHGVAMSSFHKWKAKLQGEAARVPEGEFVALPLPVSITPQPWRIELDLGEGCVLRIR